MIPLVRREISARKPGDERMILPDAMFVSRSLKNGYHLGQPYLIITTDTYFLRKFWNIYIYIYIYIKTYLYIYIQFSGD